MSKKWSAMRKEMSLLNLDSHRNKRNYLAAKEAYNAADLDSCMSFYRPDHQLMSGSAHPGRERMRAYLAGVRDTWPDIQIVVEHAVAEGDWVMGRSVVTARHTNPVNGVPPTGRDVVTTFWDLHRFDADGLIMQTWNLTDTLSIMSQIGTVKV